MSLNMSRAEYDRLAAVNWSTLRYMAKSPAHYRQALMTPREDTAALKRGRCVHLAVLEPERFAVEVVKWDGGTRRGKEWDAFKAKHEGMEILTEDEHAECVAISAAVRADPIAAKYISGGKAEQSLLWDAKRPAGDVVCKSRLDFIADVGALVDLKSTRDASPGGFGRAVVNYSMHTQAAFYSDAYRAVSGKELPFVFVAVEPEAPYAVSVFRVPDEVIQLGRETYEALLDRLLYCRAANQWPSYADTMQMLTLPAWAIPRSDEDDVSGLDLSFNAGE